MVTVIEIQNKALKPRAKQLNKLLLFFFFFFFLITVSDVDPKMSHIFPVTSVKQLSKNNKSAPKDSKSNPILPPKLLNDLSNENLIFTFFT